MPKSRVGLVEAHEVRLSFGQTPALRGASLSVSAGEILAVMGSSGSGKSTLLQCLAGILAPDSGEILLEVATLAWNVVGLWCWQWPRCIRIRSR